MLRILFLFPLLFLFTQTSSARENSNSVEAAKGVISRVFGKTVADNIDFSLIQPETLNPVFEYETSGKRLIVKGNSTVALCHGFYDYLKATHQGMVTWSGKNVMIEKFWKPVKNSG